MADISKITLPSNDEYNIKDATARSELSGKQDVITADGILQGDGEGNITAADTTATGTLSNPSSDGTYVLQNTISSGTSTLSWGTGGSGGDSGVTSVGVANATNGGLTVSGSPITSSGTITIGHSNVLTSAQTTQGLYPIKIDKNGHISAYGSAVTIPDVSGKIDTAGTGLSKSGTTLNHSNSVTAQTTQGLYPIKIDAQGHISAYGDAVTIPDVSGKIDTAGTGLSKSGTTLNHSNSVTAQTTQSVYPITIDGQGHINSYGSAVTVPKQGTWYGTCSTTASTAAKIVTCAGFELTAGNIIGIYFYYANTAATPTLNINGTGAKSIYIGDSTPDGTANVLKWSANTVVYFMCDGTYYRYITSVSEGRTIPSRGANTWYGTSDTTSGANGKVVTADNFVLTRGAIICVTFTYGNSDIANTVYLNVNSTGTTGVYYNNVVTSSTNPLIWDDNETLIFIYDGSYYHFVGKSTSLPRQSGNSGKFLTTNGSAVSWAALDLSTKANIASPTFTGTPAAPTAAAGTNTTQIATTAFVNTAVQNATVKETISLNTTWSGSGPYTKTITASQYTVTANTKVDIQLTPEQIAQLMTDGVTSMVVSNNNGTLTLYAIGAQPTTSMSIQVTYTEVA